MSHRAHRAKARPAPRGGATISTATTGSSPAGPARRVLRELVVRGDRGGGGMPITVRVVEADIATTRCAAVVNAANQLSFKPMDGGVSGALRRACTGMRTPVVDVPKRWWDDAAGTEHCDAKLPVTQAGVQELAPGCQLFDQGVRMVVHAVGPNWSDYPIADSTFRQVLPRIRRTVRRALAAAARCGATSCALPAISGGIFTHFKVGSDIKQREMRAARAAVATAVLRWAADHSTACSGDGGGGGGGSASEVAPPVATGKGPGSGGGGGGGGGHGNGEGSGSSTGGVHDAARLRVIEMCDLPARKRGAAGVFAAAFDEAAERWRAAAAGEQQQQQQQRAEAVAVTAAADTTQAGGEVAEAVPSPSTAGAAVEGGDGVASTECADAENVSGGAGRASDAEAL